jgi:hypothetical protein
MRIEIALQMENDSVREHGTIRGRFTDSEPAEAAQSPPSPGFRGAASSRMSAHRHNDSRRGFVGKAKTAHSNPHTGQEKEVRRMKRLVVQTTGPGA